MLFNRSEHDLEQLIYDQRFTIHERGFPRFYANTKRQFRLPNGKVIDIFTWEVVDDCLRYKIIELKKDWLTGRSLAQLANYYVWIKTFLTGNFRKIEPELILVGYSSDANLLDLVEMGIKVSTYHYNWNEDGLTFQKWKQVKEYRMADLHIDHIIQGRDLSEKLRKGYDLR